VAGRGKISEVNPVQQKLQIWKGGASIIIKLIGMIYPNFTEVEKNVLKSEEF